MPRFLSPEWFEAVARRGPPASTDQDLVLEQVVRDTPDGEVRYRVVVSDGRAYVEAPSPGQTAIKADLTITCDWATAAAVAQGLRSAQSALMEGDLRVQGDLARL